MRRVDVPNFAQYIIDKKIHFLINYQKLLIIKKYDINKKNTGFAYVFLSKKKLLREPKNQILGLIWVGVGIDHIYTNIIFFICV